jgi:PPOX class probable F420-dependent enzyme
MSRVRTGRQLRRRGLGGFARRRLRKGPGVTEIPESHRDLLESEFATLGTVGHDGLPQLTEVWFLSDSGELKISLNESRAKTKNLQARPACSVLILDLTNPYRYLEIRGRARIEDDADYAFAARVGQKYGSDLREHDGPRDTRVVVTVEPEKVHAVDMSG